MPHGSDLRPPPAVLPGMVRPYQRRWLHHHPLRCFRGSTHTPVGCGDARFRHRSHGRDRPRTIWDLVSDVTKIGRYSPETFEAEWLDGATGPAVGATFRGHVKRNGMVRSTGRPAP